MAENQFKASEMSAADYQRLQQTGEKPKVRSGQPERIMQKKCVRWFRFDAYQAFAHLLYAIPNAAKRSYFEQKQVEDDGVVSGVPDLKLAVARGGWYGLYIEMKVGDNKPTKAQQFMLAELYKQGYLVKVVYTFEDFQTLINKYMALPVVWPKRYSL